MNPGDTIIVVTDYSDPDSTKEYVVKKFTKGKPGEDTVSTDAGIFYAAFCWPIEAKEELMKVIKERHRLKKAYDDSMDLVYELKNKIARGEIGVATE